jgi:hypothetical protein
MTAKRTGAPWFESTETADAGTVMFERLGLSSGRDSELHVRPPCGTDVTRAMTP